MARKNPLGTIGATLLVGVVIGMMSARPRVMLSTALRLFGTDLSRQFERLRFALEDFKDRTADDLKQKAIGAGVTIGLAFAGMLFALLTVFAGLAALYLYVDYERGPLVALGAVALITAALAILLFALVVLRGRKCSPAAPAANARTTGFGDAVSHLLDGGGCQRGLGLHGGHAAEELAGNDFGRDGRSDHRRCRDRASSLSTVTLTSWCATTHRAWN